MGGKNRSSEAPQFVKDASQALAGRSEQLWDLSRPLLETGTGQIASLIRTGGVGANVPIINNAVAAQQSAGRLATTGYEGATTMQRRGKVPSFLNRRTNEYLRQETSSAARRIPYQAAAPLIGASTTAALSGGGTAQQGFAGAAGALAAGQREPRRSANLTSAGGNLMRAALFGLGGGFSGLGSLGGGKGGTQILNNGGTASMPGLMLEF